MPAAETLRSREVYKYYQPSNTVDADVPDSPFGFDSQLLSPSATDTHFTTQESFSDTALTAFAQLIALRLNSQRAIVSLIDRDNEYFLAESTSTFSHVDDEGARNAWLSIRGGKIPRFASLCEKTLYHARHRHQNTASVVMISDLRLDERLSGLDSVTGPPYLRFYCGVPLTNKNGVNIGCVYVVDDRPRESVSEPQAQYLNIMAETIMDHLENIRAKEDITRVTHMSQALHAFIEGDGTMDGDWQRLKKYYPQAGGAAVGFRWETNLDEQNDVQEGSSMSIPLSSGIDMGQNRIQVQSPLQSSSPLQHVDPKQDSYYNFNSSPWSSSSDVPQLPAPLESVHTRIDSILKAAKTGKDATQFVDGFSNLLHMTFSRASNLIREGMEVDGSVFFDAPERFYQGRSRLESGLQWPIKRGSMSSSESDDDEDKETKRDARPGPRPLLLVNKYHRSQPHGRSRSGSPAPKVPGKDDSVKSDVLGFSTTGASSLKGQTTEETTAFTAISQRLMANLVRRYPQGKLFVFDDDGPVYQPKHTRTNDSGRTITSSAGRQEKRARHKARKHAEILSLLAAFPGARQIFFVPLLDSTSGCFIGSFVWSTSTTRVFSVENHLSYLVAFGHSVMGELITLNTLSADRAKGDFISNVSHELRSPLHGILASVEFLTDTALDGFQKNLVDTVDICGRTLLDTIEHILDFTKIKKYGQESMQPIGVVANLDVSSVIEEVLEGVYAGFEFNGLSSQGLADTTLSGSRSAKEKIKSAESLEIIPNDLVTVILDIDFRQNWNFPTVPGTWRRLTMNLFGNALKYTKAGWIKVMLQAENMPHETLSDSSNGVDRTMVILTVSDSGQGMSSDFTEQKLFMPFSQEDVTTPGTGLGMSIVKQIVDLSAGKVEVQSELGVGTKVKLSLPMYDHQGEAKDDNLSVIEEELPENTVTAVRRRAKGRLVTIRGFENKETDSQLQIEAQAHLRASIINYVTEWFNLSIVPSDSTNAAEIVITDEAQFFNASSTEGKVPDKCLLVVCGSGARHNIYGSPLDGDKLVEFVGKPCGPHRLANALLRCLNAEEAQSQQVSIKEAGSAVLVHHVPVISTEKALETTNKENDKLAIPLQPSTAEQNSVGTLTSEDSMTSTTTNDTISDSVSPNSSTDAFEDALRYTGPSHRPKMLLVEDNPVNMMLLSTYMAKNKWEFEKACNGLEALEACQNRPQGFDVIFMDVSMPIMTGYEATRAIRALEQQRRTHPQSKPLFTIAHHLQPLSDNSLARTTTSEVERGSRKVIDVYNKPALIIALTGFSSREDQEAASESGMDVFMTKPVRFKEVGKILEGFMKDREI